jgi:hypothetical protein
MEPQRDQRAAQPFAEPRCAVVARAQVRMPDEAGERGREVQCEFLALSVPVRVPCRHATWYGMAWDGTGHGERR